MALSIEQQMLVEQRLANDRKSTAVAYVLWFFLGGFGAHRFYLGKTGTGVMQLALLLLGIVTLVVYVGALLLAVLGIWVLADAFLIPGIAEAHTRTRRTAIASEIALVTTA